MLKKYNHLLIIFLFIIPISLPIVIWLGVPDKEQSVSEKREFAIQPNFPRDMKSIEAFPDLFSAYYADHFGLREYLSKAYKTLKFKLGDSPSDDVTIGKDGWLFFGSIKELERGYNNPFDNARNSSLYSQVDLEKTAQHFIQLQRWLAEKGIKYIFIIAPNKHTIYFDKLPDYVKKFIPFLPQISWLTIFE